MAPPARDENGYIDRIAIGDTVLVLERSMNGDVLEVAATTCDGEHGVYGDVDRNLTASADGRIALAWNGLGVLDQDGTRSSVYEVEDTGSDVLRTLKAPMWSPDGGSLAFVEVVRVDFDYEATLVKRLDLATGTVTLVTEVSEPAGGPVPALVGEVFSACWTPDGSTIVFTAPVDRSGYAVFAAPSSGGDATRITSRPGAVDVSVSCL